MSRLRAFSSPDLVPSDSGSVTSPTRTTEHQSHETSGLEGSINHITFYILIFQLFLLIFFFSKLIKHVNEDRLKT